MKRVIRNSYLIALTLFLLTSKSLAKENYNQNFKDLPLFAITKLASGIKHICKSNNFFKNLKQHKSYPNFGKTTDWKNKCKKLNSITNDKELNSFFEREFLILNKISSPDLLTGYYEPIIKVSKVKNRVFKYPILKKNPKFIGKTREFIEKEFNKDDVLLWSNDKIDLFFLHIQGSGLGVFENKKTIKIAYAGNNNLNYTSIGKYLIKNKYLEASNTNLFTIKGWLRKNHKISNKVMNLNKRFIFFKENIEAIGESPVGAIGLKLKPNESIAVDDKLYPIGIPFIIEFLGDKSIKPVVSLDTGSAIIGHNRADLFTGRGKSAEKKAGILKKKIYLYPIIPYIN